MSWRSRWPIRSGASRHSAIGFSILEGAINLVQLRIDGPRPVVSAAALIEVERHIEDLLEQPALLKQMLAPELKHGFVGRKIVSCLPPEHFRLLYINYKAAGASSVGDAILQQVKGRLEGPLENFVLDYLPIRSQSAGDEQLALVAVAERSVVIDFLEHFRRAGLYVDALEIAPVAINRLLASVAAPDNHHNSIAISLGRYKSSLAVFSGRRLILDREVMLGERDMVQQLCRSLDMEEAFARRMLGQQLTPSAENEASYATGLPETVGQILKPLFLKLSQEIEKATLYTASQTRGEPIREVFLLGAAGQWPVAKKVLQDIVHLPVQVLSPVSTYQPLGEFLGVPPELAQQCLPLSCGLALRGMSHE
ncbi:pilus assembly protein PilM [Litorivivens sp.]|uniref:pilus assembly protein PilM n=1 Tax=Litorivivens sp. TaxID=2020868 RepID=UPI0035680D16